MRVLVLLRLLIPSADGQGLEIMESERLSSLKLLGLHFVICEKESLFLRGGCMNIIHENSE